MILRVDKLLTELPTPKNPSPEAAAVGELGLAAALVGACAMSDRPQDDDRTW